MTSRIVVKDGIIEYCCAVLCDCLNSILEVAEDLLV